ALICLYLPVVSVMIKFFSYVFVSLASPPPRSTLFPYTTLFRSSTAHRRLPNANCRRCLFSRKSRSRMMRRWRGWDPTGAPASHRSEEHTSELQSLRHLVCRLLLEKKKIRR